MKELTAEGLVPLAEAAREAGIPVHVETLKRWATRGVRGHQLEVVMLGPRWHTTTAALLRFLAATNEVGE